MLCWRLYDPGEGLAPSLDRGTEEVCPVCRRQEVILSVKLHVGEAGSVAVVILGAELAVPLGDKGVEWVSD